MGNIKKLHRPQRVNILAEEKDLKYLKSKGINRSKFFRQSIEHFKQGMIIYNFVEGDEIDDDE